MFQVKLRSRAVDCSKQRRTSRGDNSTNTAHNEGDLQKADACTVQREGWCTQRNDEAAQQQRVGNVDKGKHIA